MGIAKRTIKKTINKTVDKATDELLGNDNDKLRGRRDDDNDKIGRKKKGRLRR